MGWFTIPHVHRMKGEEHEPRNKLSEYEAYWKSYVIMLPELSTAMYCLEKTADRSYTIKKSNEFLSV